MSSLIHSALRFSPCCATAYRGKNCPSQRYLRRIALFSTKTGTTHQQLQVFQKLKEKLEGKIGGFDGTGGCTMLKILNLALKYSD